MTKEQELVLKVIKERTPILMDSDSDATRLRKAERIVTLEHLAELLRMVFNGKVSAGYLEILDGFKVD